MVDMKITLLGLIDVPVHTTLLPTTDLKITQTTPPASTFVPIGAAPTLVDGVYRSGGTAIPMLQSCSPAVFSADPGWPVHAQVWGSGGLGYGLDLVRFGVLGSCGGAAHAFTQRVQWGSGAAAQQILAAQSQVTGLAIGLPSLLLPEVLGRSVVSADVLSSRAACPSTASMAPAAALTVVDLELLGALGVTVGTDGTLLALTRPNGTEIPLVTAVGVDIGIPGLQVDLEVGGDALVELRVGLAADELGGTLLDPVPALLDGLLGLDADVVVYAGQPPRVVRGERPRRERPRSGPSPGSSSASTSPAS